jgi:hypothetical protein
MITPLSNMTPAQQFSPDSIGSTRALNLDLLVRKHDPGAAAIKHAHQGSMAGTQPLEFGVIRFSAPGIGRTPVDMNVNEDIIIVIVAAADLHDHLGFQRIPMVANGWLGEPITSEGSASLRAVFVDHAAAVAGTAMGAPVIVRLIERSNGQELAA